MLICLTNHNPLKSNDMKDLQVLKKRVLEPFFKKEIQKEKIKKYLKNQLTDGSWKDLNYKHKSPFIWKTSHHLGRIMKLGLAYKHPDSPFKGDRKVKASILKGMDYWLQHDFKNSNWWWNIIDIPRRISEIGILMGDDFSKNQKKKMIAIIKRSDLKGNPYHLTGQNLVWQARNNINLGIFQKKVKTTKQALLIISNEIKVSVKEGIQHDNSFHQHGALLYNHGYGAGFAVDCTHLIKLAYGTQFAFSKKKISIMSNYILDSSQWMIYKNTLDYGANGRAITRPNKSAKYLIRASENLIAIKAERTAEFKELIKRINKQEATPLVGNKYFWRTDFMAHQRGAYYTSARMHSKRTFRSDGAHNGEGKTIHHMADGCNFLMVTGDEYIDIYPLWDWKKIPGTTIEQNKKFKSKTNIKGEKNFVGGVSDGNFGMSFFNFKYLKLSAHKAWFFFDDEYVCLGSAINCKSSNNVVTTINQCFLKGKTTVFSNGRKHVLAKSNRKLKSAQAIHHNKVAYILNSKATVALKNNAQKGNWKKISDDQSDKVITKDIFKLYLEHGSKPTNKKYAYTVVPNIKASEVEKYIKKENIKILKNTKDIQAVTSTSLNLTQIAFFKPSTLKIDASLSVTVDKMCLLMIQRIGNNIKLSISDPMQKLKTINVQISGKLTGKSAKHDSTTNTTTISVNLPRGPYSGKTVIYHLKNIK